MSSFLNLPSPPLPAPLRALQAATTRQDADSGSSTNMRPIRHRRSAHDHDHHQQPNQPNPLPVPNDDDNHENQPCPPTNETMLQGFEWYVPADGSHWRRLEKVLPSLAALGVTKLWIPPACKAACARGNGYDVYDLYDLGEFEQKGRGKGTKWGTKEELVRLGEVAARYGVGVLFDAVLNHKTGADFCETVEARRVDEKDRRREVVVEGGSGGGVGVIGAWTGFEFPARKGRYSGMRWNKEHFTGVDYDDKTQKTGVWKLEGKEWAEDVDEELGNYDFLLFADIDHKHPEVREDMFRWVEWLPRQMKLGGLRLDAIKHYSFEFQRDLVAHIKERVDPGWLIVGEYWREDSEFLAKFIEYMGHQVSLFDVQLVSNFSRVSLKGEKGDLRKVLDDSLALWKPDNATFVVNHDTQAGQSLETPVAPFFIPIAYALILLRANSGLPCVFYADLFGSIGQHPQPGFTNFIPPTSGGAVLPKLMLARKLWAYGSQYDYFDEPNCIGFTRVGHRAQSGGDGLAVVMTNAWEHARKTMFVGKHHAGEVWTDVLMWCPGHVVIGADGWGVFPVARQSVAVWVNIDAPARNMVCSYIFDHDIYGLEAERRNTMEPLERATKQVAS
ncbi:alpha-amylase [Chaetomidium leptoderma]|uniref:Alpha-amylase n=1 Tax=Chaetomidium leptoderma TaxID=669021 RepID=A0AAN6VDH7_9PEZI|nr:alpha-amylase [Chaetomidium leptoderma]